MTKNPIQHYPGQALHDLFREVFALQEALCAIMDKVHDQVGLTKSQLKIMRSLIQIGPATAPDIGAELGVSRQYIQSVLNDLLPLGFIEFKENPRHKRSKFASLTETGSIAFEKARQKEIQFIKKALPEIDPERARVSRELLKCIRMALVEEL